MSHHVKPMRSETAPYTSSHGQTQVRTFQSMQSSHQVRQAQELQTQTHQTTVGYTVREVEKMHEVSRVREVPMVAQVVERVPVVERVLERVPVTAQVSTHHASVSAASMQSNMTSVTSMQAASMQSNARATATATRAIMDQGAVAMPQRSLTNGPMILSSSSTRRPSMDQSPKVEEIHHVDEHVMHDEELQARLDAMQEILMRQIQELEEIIDQKLGKVIEMTNTLSNSCEQRFSWLEKKGLERQAAIDDMSRDVEQMKVEMRNPQEDLWSKERPEVFAKLAGFQNDLGSVQSQQRATSLKITTEEEHQLKIETSISALRLDFEKALNASQTHLNKDIDSMQDEYRKVEKELHILRRDIEQQQQTERRERVELGRSLEMESTTRNQEAYEEREKRTRIVADLQQGLQALNLRLTDMEADQSSARLRETSDMQMRLDAFKSEIDKMRSDNEKMSACLREFGKQKRDIEIPHDLAELRRVMHDLADVSRLQGEKLDELERDMEFSREGQKTIGKMAHDPEVARDVSRLKAEMMEQRVQTERHLTELRREMENAGRQAQRNSSLSSHSTFATESRDTREARWAPESQDTREARARIESFSHSVMDSRTSTSRVEALAATSHHEHSTRSNVKLSDILHGHVDRDGLGGASPRQSLLSPRHSLAPKDTSPRPERESPRGLTLLPPSYSQNVLEPRGSTNPLSGPGSHSPPRSPGHGSMDLRLLPPSYSPPSYLTTPMPSEFQTMDSRLLEQQK